MCYKRFLELECAKNFFFLKLCLARKTNTIICNTTSNKSFVIWGCNAIDMNKFEPPNLQDTGGLEIKYELWTNFPSLIMQRRYLFLGVVQSRELRLSNIIPPPTSIYWFKVVIQKVQTNTYWRGTHGCHLSSLHIPHGLWTLIPIYLYETKGFPPKSYECTL